MNLQTVVEQTIARVGNKLIVGAPLGLGKPNPVLNAFYQYARQHTDIELTIFTALSLAVPSAGKGLQRRLLAPFLQRHFGTDYPHLDYLRDLQNNALPANITVHEFYLQSGSMLKNDTAQQNYISSNYTHVARDMDHIGVNVICQMVVGNGDDNAPRYSLSCNPDVTLDLLDRVAERREQVVTIAMVNPQLPYMGGDAEVAADFFDIIIDEAELYHQPFAVPRGPVGLAEHMIGIHASTLLRDGGTLQIGIGALGDAICHAAILRQQQPDQYQALLRALAITQRYDKLLQQHGGTGTFVKGLYAASEMFMDGFLHLYDAGILRRQVYDDVGLQSVLNSFTQEAPANDALLQELAAHGVINHQLRPHDLDWLQHWGLLDTGVIVHEQNLCLDDQRTVARIDQERDFSDRIKPFLGPGLRHGKLLHAAFFLGSQWFYDKLRNMPVAERAQFMMTRVSRINQLYGGEQLDRVQRHGARFVNTCMKMTLLGAAVSDQLADARIISGVGGQYNFVAMGHALAQSRSILMLRSVRESATGLESNIVWEYPQQTIPRHLRDIVITEYGIADLRGQHDAECIKRMICIADSRFQQSLRAQAIKAGKLEADWQLPAQYRHNTTDDLRRRLTPALQQALPRWPFGSELDDAELALAAALKWLARQPKWKLAWLALKPTPAMENEQKLLQRMQLVDCEGLKQRLERRLLRRALYQQQKS